MKHLTLAAACVTLLAAPAWGQWSDDFQSYAIGSAIVGQGDWEGWDGTAFPDALIAADPDPLAPPGNKVLQEATNNDIVHQYAGYTSGAWVYTARQFIPASRHGSGNTSFIMMNNYTVGGNPKAWALSLTFDLTRDLVFDEEGGFAPVAVVYDQWKEIRVEIDLDHNVRRVLYGGAEVGFGPWYSSGDANHAKKIAAVDLWADAGGNPVYYDDISLAAGSPLVVVPANDITTVGTATSKYFVNVGGGLEDLTDYPQRLPSGMHVISSSGGNQNHWWKLNDGDPGTSSSMVTWSGSNPDYFGFTFKLPATVEKLVWWNDARYGDGGTFAAEPQVQYLDAVNGTWHTIVGVTWPRAYLNEYGCGIRRYEINLNTPVEHVWGIRLIGTSSEVPNARSVAATDDDGAAIAGAGFVGTTELTLYGTVEVGALDLSNNLALGVNGAAPIARYCQQGAVGIARLNDGLIDVSGDSFGNVSPTREDWVGVSWPAAQNNVAAVGLFFNGFKDGGYFGDDLCDDGASVRVEYTTDGTNWFPVAGLDRGSYPAEASKLQATCKPPTPLEGQKTPYLFRFTPVSGITGIRIIGDPSGYATGDGDGFLGWLEFEVFANSLGGKPQAEATTRGFLPSLESLAGKTLGQLRATKLF